MSDFVILDVAHGNCALLRDGAAVAVIDAPTRSLLLDTLDDLGIDTVHSAFISHADKDHIAGILAMLTSDRIKVEQIFVNPDGQRNSKIWRDFLTAVSVAHRKGDCAVRTSLTASEPGAVTVGNVEIAIIAPSPRLALTGVGGKDAQGRALTANSLSAVLKISEGGAPAALLAGDMDEIGLDDAIAHDADLTAKLLVFPHHGGLPGGNAEAFTGKLYDRVRPEAVLFSNGRNRHDNPRPEIIDAMIESSCAVACTQLSERCSARPIEGDRDDLEPFRSSGRANGGSCAGSMSIELAGGARRVSAAAAQHARFIDDRVPTPMCRRAALALSLVNEGA